MSDDEKRGPGRPSKSAAETVRAVVLRDFWPTDKDDDRVRAGTVIEVPKDELISGMERGLLARAPAED